MSIQGAAWGPVTLVLRTCLLKEGLKGRKPKWKLLKNLRAAGVGSPVLGLSRVPLLCRPPHLSSRWQPRGNGGRQSAPRSVGCLSCIRLKIKTDSLAHGGNGEGSVQFKKNLHPPTSATSPGQRGAGLGGGGGWPWSQEVWFWEGSTLFHTWRWVLVCQIHCHAACDTGLASRFQKHMVKT